MSDTKRVRLKVTMYVEVNEPSDWTKENTEFYWNDGTACLDGLLNELVELQEPGLCSGSCWSVDVEHAGVVETPKPGRVAWADKPLTAEVERE